MYLQGSNAFIGQFPWSLRKHPGQWTDRWGSDPAGGVGRRKSEIAGVLFTRRAPFAREPLRVMLGARRWRISASVGFWGVGASGSTIAKTNVSWARLVALLVRDTVGRRAFSTEPAGSAGAFHSCYQTKLTLARQVQPRRHRSVRIRNIVEEHNTQQTGGVEGRDHCNNESLSNPTAASNRIANVPLGTILAAVKACST